jgi:hypothetical protein
MITFTLNGNPFAGNTATTNSSGVATLSNVSLAGINAGNYPTGVGGGFAGDTTYAPSGGSNSLTVNQASTTSTVTSSANPSLLNQPISFTAVVASGAGTPTGAVQFKIDGSNFGSPVTPSGGKATSGSISTIAVGSHAITAVYSGAANFSGSTGTLAQQVAFQIKALYDQSGVNSSGASVPIKVQLQDAKGTNLSSSKIVLTLSTSALAPSPSPGAQPSGTFTFMPTSDKGPMYQFNLKTTGYPKHTYTLSFTVAGDPVTHTVQFVIG